MNNYCLSYTIFNPSAGKSQKVLHKKFSFDSEFDLLGAADEVMSKVFDQYENNKKEQVLFRKIELTNASEVYNKIIEVTDE